jgi:hypothetical protein
VHRVILGPNVLDGEVTQLFVPGGWWKASEIPEEDRLLLDSANGEAEMKERIGCLISEVVVPGWQPEQHMFIDEDKVSWPCAEEGEGEVNKGGRRRETRWLTFSSRRCGVGRKGGSRTPSTSSRSRGLYLWTRGSTSCVRP